MRKTFFILLLISQLSFSQSITYQPSNEKLFDLIHTTLQIKPDWPSQTLIGNAMISLKPYFYNQNSLVLNAKGFKINGLKLNKQTAKYTYDNEVLKIDLEKYYTRNDTLFVEINYVAQPNSIKTVGSDVILSDKGLYFINSDEKIKGLPRQIWTQGETQANSCWFPTIDSPNQKHSQDIFVNVESKFTTLSNGLLADSKSNPDGTRTDHWIQSQPFSVYLSMFAAGNFKKVVDSTFKEFEISYYLEPEYEKDAYGIFGRTPEMVKYFESILGVKYPWKKYAQIPVRQYVSGAMENVTATIHGKSVMKKPGQLIDSNDDGVIAHELFHHWFGNYVTCESWSNLPLNESFANYSEYLWAAHKYGEDEADFINVNALSEYLNESNSKLVPIIRYSYADKEDMFDAHSYQKGGRVLHTLRKEVGDEAFFKSLNLYLKSHAFENAEIEDLRLAFEKITGRDMKLFFTQFFLSPGHPRLILKSEVKNETLKLNISQVVDSLNTMFYNTQFQLRILDGDKVIDKTIKISDLEEDLEFKVTKDFKSIIVNPKGDFFGVIYLEKTLADYVTQYQISDEYYAKLQALEFLMYVPESAENTISKSPLEDDEVRKVMISALKDKNWRIRQYAVQKFFDYDGKDFLEIEKALQYIIKYDEKTAVKADAVLAMKNFLNPQNDILFREALKSPSYLLNASALEALLVNEVGDMENLITPFRNINDVNLFASVGQYLAKKADPEDYDWFIDRLRLMEGYEIYQSIGIFSMYLTSSEVAEKEKAVPFLEDFATKQNEWFVRASAAQILSIFAPEVPSAKQALTKVLATEKDERLINYYKQFNN